MINDLVQRAKLPGTAYCCRHTACTHLIFLAMGLRCLICGVSIYLAFAAYGWIRDESLRLGVCIGLGICAAVYNPIIKVRLDRDAWEIINGLTIAGLVLVTLVLRSSRVKHGISGSITPDVVKMSDGNIVTSVKKVLSETNEGGNTAGRVIKKTLMIYVVMTAISIPLLLVMAIVNCSRIPSQEELKKPIDRTTIKKTKKPTSEPASIADPQQ